MSKSPHYSTVRDYETAAHYLSFGKNKNDRPAGSNTRLMRMSDSAIGVKYHYTIIVVFHSDGTQTITSGGWDTVTTKQRINQWSAARVYSCGGMCGHENNRRHTRQWAIWHDSDKRSDPRVWKCRTCSGTKGRWDWEYLGYGYHNGHYRAIQGPRRKEWRKCWRCEGTGKADYGSRPIPYHWMDGSQAVRIDDTGKVLGEDILPLFDEKYIKPSTSKTNTWPTWTDAVPPIGPSYNFTGSVVDELATVVPGVLSLVPHPCECYPASQGAASALHTVVVHLNDKHQWTREAIADWMEALDIDLRMGVKNDGVVTVA